MNGKNGKPGDNSSGLESFNLGIEDINGLKRKIERTKGVEIILEGNRLAINHSYHCACQLITNTIAEITISEKGYVFTQLYQPKPGDIVKEETVNKACSSIERKIKKYIKNI